MEETNKQLAEYTRDRIDSLLRLLNANDETGYYDVVVQIEMAIEGLQQLRQNIHEMEVPIVPFRNGRYLSKDEMESED